MSHEIELSYEPFDQWKIRTKEVVIDAGMDQLGP